MLRLMVQKILMELYSIDHPEFVEIDTQFGYKKFLWSKYEKYLKDKFNLY